MEEVDTVAARKKVMSCLDHIHWRMTQIRIVAETSGNKEWLDAIGDMDVMFLASVKRLRQAFNVPYGALVK